MFTIFDRDALLEALKAEDVSQSKFYRIGGTSSLLYDTSTDEGGERLRPLAITEWDEAMTDIAMSGINGAASENAAQATRNILQQANPYYADEIPPLKMAA